MKKEVEKTIRDREDHCLGEINAVLDISTIVLCDRYKYSAYAYQQSHGILFDKIDK